MKTPFRKVLNAITIGFLAVILFKLLYYKGAGLVADIALLLNVFFIIAILSAFNLTLTLTSIAGLILTVGMAGGCECNYFLKESRKNTDWANRLKLP